MIVVISVLFVAVFFGLFFLPEQIPKSCDLSNPSNIDFDKYFGISLNYFKLNPVAEILIEKLNFPFFRFWPLKDNASFYVLGSRGSGKSALRMHLLEHRFPDEKSWRIELIPRTIDDYFVTFIDRVRTNNVRLSSTNDSIVFAENWEAHDFAHMLLAQLSKILVLDFHSSLHKTNFWRTLSQKPEFDRLKFVTILSIFNDGSMMSSLRDCINTVMNFQSSPGWFSSEVLPQIDQLGTSSSDVFNVLNDIANEVRVLPRHRLPIRLLQHVYTHLDISIPAVSLQKPFFLIWDVAQFLEKFNKRVVVVMDGIDEHSLISGSLNHTLKSFINSTTESEFHSLIMSDSSISQLAFFPLTSVDHEAASPLRKMRKDKINVITLEWDFNMLKIVADMFFHRMRQESNRSKRCKELPDFNKMVDTEYLGAQKALNHPRDLVTFMNILIHELQINPAIGENPFIASKEIIQKVLLSQNWNSRA